MSGRIPYVGKSAEDLGVPAELSIHGVFTSGVRFPGHDRNGEQSPFLAPDMVTVDAEHEEGADILVSEPGEFDDADVLIVVVVNERIVHKRRLHREIKRLTSATPDSPSHARVFAPERAPGSRRVTDILQQHLDDECIAAEVLPYYPSP